MHFARDLIQWSGYVNIMPLHVPMHVNTCRCMYQCMSTLISLHCQHLCHCMYQCMLTLMSLHCQHLCHCMYRCMSTLMSLHCQHYVIACTNACQHFIICTNACQHLCHCMYRCMSTLMSLHVPMHVNTSSCVPMHVNTYVIACNMISQLNDMLRDQSIMLFKFPIILSSNSF